MLGLGKIECLTKIIFVTHPKMKFTELLYNTYLTVATVASLSALGVIAVSLIYIKDALETHATTTLRMH